MVPAFLIGLGLLFPFVISKVSALVLYPFHITSTWIKTSDGVIPLYFQKRETLVNEVETLRTKLATEASSELSLQRLRHENEEFQKLAGGVGEDRLIAQVLARPDQLAYDLIQIDKGLKDGVVEGALVYVGIDTVVGVILQVEAEYSFIELFTSPGFEINAYILGLNIFSTMEGMGGGISRIKLPQGITLEKGQVVILPGLTGGVFGQVVEIESIPTQREQYGYIAPTYAMNDLTYVTIGRTVAEKKTAVEINEVVQNLIRSSLELSTSTISELASTSNSIVVEEEIIEEDNVVE